MAEIDKNVRKGIKLYKDYFEAEFKDLTDEEVGILVIALYQYDEFGKPTEEYAKKINNDRMLKSAFKRISINNDRAVEKWNQTREYFAKKDKQKRIKEIMKIEECSFEDAVDIYDFQNMTSDKSKTEKAKAETKVEEPKVSKQFKGAPFNLIVNVSENCEIKDSDIKTATDYLEEIGKYEEMKSIIVSAIQEADKDNYKYNFMTYVMTQIEDEVMNNSKSKASDEKDEFPF